MSFSGRDTRICLHAKVSYPAPVILPVANLRTRLANSVRRSRGKNVTHYSPGYVVDHIVALKRGGADHPGNMQWQTSR
jgi:hypothetical protein